MRRLPTLTPGRPDGWGATDPLATYGNHCAAVFMFYLCSLWAFRNALVNITCFPFFGKLKENPQGLSSKSKRDIWKNQLKEAGGGKPSSTPAATVAWPHQLLEGVSCGPYTWKTPGKCGLLLTPYSQTITRYQGSLVALTNSSAITNISVPSCKGLLHL